VSAPPGLNAPDLPDREAAWDTAARELGSVLKAVGAAGNTPPFFAL